MNVRAVFIAIRPDAKEIMAPFYRELAMKHGDVMVFNSGPVCQEIKDRNVAITNDTEKDADLIKSFGCGSVCLTKSTDLSMGISAIEREAQKGGA